MSLYKVLEQIETRPSMYLERPGFVSLIAFISGYEHAIISNHLFEHEEPLFLGFNEFVLAHFGRDGEQVSVNLCEVSWQRAIIDAETDDAEAFTLFFQLLRNFRQHLPPSELRSPVA